MAHEETMNAQSNGPEILERLSEIELRDESRSPHPRPSRDPRGRKVLNTTNHEVGKVDDLYVDPNPRQPNYAVLGLGNHALGIGNRSVLVRFEDLTIEGSDYVRVRVAIG